MTRILVVDNYDSFVFTIVGYLEQLGAECTVVRNDAVTITAFLDEIAEVPKRGALFVVGSDTYKVDAVTAKDESRAVCVVTT